MVKGRKLESPARFKTWAVVNFDSKVSEQDAKTFASNLLQCCLNLGKRSSLSMCLKFVAQSPIVRNEYVKFHG